MSLSGSRSRGASERQPDAPAAYQSALRSLSAREMSGLEVTRALRRRGHARHIVAEVVERLRSEGWVDDLRFACAFLRYRMRAKPASIHQLRAELAQRGCAPETVEMAVADVAVEDGPFDDIGLARAAVARRRGVDSRNPERLLRFLARRGFSFDVARRAVEEAGIESARSAESIESARFSESSGREVESARSRTAGLHSEIPWEDDSGNSRFDSEFESEPGGEPGGDPDGDSGGELDASSDGDSDGDSGGRVEPFPGDPR